MTRRYKIAWSAIGIGVAIGVAVVSLWPTTRQDAALRPMPDQPEPAIVSMTQDDGVKQFLRDLPPLPPITAEEQAVYAAEPEREFNGQTGNYGWQPPTDEEFVRSVEERPADQRRLKDANPDLFKGAQAKDPVLLYRAMLTAHRQVYGRDYVTVQQGIGDCVSQGWAHGVSISLAIDYLLGNAGEFEMASSESIYGVARVEGRGLPGDGKRPYGGFSDGSWSSAAAKIEKHGLLYRRQYPSLNLDLSQYSSKRAKEWGAYGLGGKDDGGRADAVARQFPVRKTTLCPSIEEAIAAIENGYPVPVASGQGFSTQRDSDGFCAARGSWAHQMCFCGVRYDRPGLLCLNSWGPSGARGPKYPADQIEGSFWVDLKTADRMLRQRDSHAVGSVQGFPRRKFDWSKW